MKHEKLEPGFAFNRVAQATDGYSGSDLEELCRQAAYRAVRDLLAKERAQISGEINETELLNLEPRPLKVTDFLVSTSQTDVFLSLVNIVLILYTLHERKVENLHFVY